MRIMSRCAITGLARGKRATSECARLTELVPGTTSITAPIIGQQLRCEEKTQRRQNGAQRRSVMSLNRAMVFGNLAETCAKYLARGRQVYVEGRSRTREFEGKNGGGKRQRAEIVAQRVQFLGPRPEAPAGGEAEEPAGGRRGSILSGLKAAQFLAGESPATGGG